jgi:hypothetical protein
MPRLRPAWATAIMQLAQMMPSIQRAGERMLRTMSWIATQILEECVNRIVTHGGNLIGLLGVMPDVRECSGVTTFVRANPNDIAH